MNFFGDFGYERGYFLGDIKMFEKSVNLLITSTSLNMTSVHSPHPKWLEIYNIFKNMINSMLLKNTNIAICI